MSVYFVYSVRGNLLKIGSAINPRARIFRLRAETGLPLYPLIILPGALKTERKYQKRFAATAIEASDEGISQNSNHL